MREQELLQRKIMKVLRVINEGEYRIKIVEQKNLEKDTTELYELIARLLVNNFNRKKMREKRDGI